MIKINSIHGVASQSFFTKNYQFFLPYSTPGAHESDSCEKSYLADGRIITVKGRRQSFIVHLNLISVGIEL